MCGFGGQVGKQHLQNGFPALLKPCGAVVGRSRRDRQDRRKVNPTFPRRGKVKLLIQVEPTKVRTKSGEVRNGTLQFTIRPIQEAVDYKLEKELAALPEKKRARKRR